ncbi:MAG: hypothetical protein EXX96DRAFT_85900 [Benjaminiella poitrasii]|nr:MAG: hypothetical protein EXX96DRAFT_85900 [Benjaminiella poitrasii]
MHPIKVVQKRKRKSHNKIFVRSSSCPDFILTKAYLFLFYVQLGYFSVVYLINRSTFFFISCDPVQFAFMLSFVVVYKFPITLT